MLRFRKRRAIPTASERARLRELRDICIAYWPDGGTIVVREDEVELLEQARREAREVWLGLRENILSRIEPELAERLRAMERTGTGRDAES